MISLLTRLIASALTFCLLADPVTASGFAPSHPSKSTIPDLTQPAVSQQALLLPIVFTMGAYNPPMASSIRRMARPLLEFNFRENAWLLGGIGLYVVALTGIVWFLFFRKTPAQVTSFEEFSLRREQMRGKKGFLGIEPVLWMGMASSGALGSFWGAPGAALGVASGFFIIYLFAGAFSGENDFQPVSYTVQRQIADLLRTRLGNKESDPPTRTHIKRLIDILDKPVPISVGGQSYHVEVLISPTRQPIQSPGSYHVEKRMSATGEPGVIQIFVEQDPRVLLSALMHTLILSQDPSIHPDRYDEIVLTAKWLLEFETKPARPDPPSVEDKTLNTPEETLKILELIKDPKAVFPIVDPTDSSMSWEIPYEMAIKAVKKGAAVGLQSGAALVWTGHVRMRRIATKESREIISADEIRFSLPEHHWTLRPIDQMSMLLIHTSEGGLRREIGIIEINEYKAIGPHGFVSEGALGSPSGKPKFFNLQLRRHKPAGFKVIVTPASPHWVDAQWTEPSKPLQQQSGGPVAVQPDSHETTWKSQGVDPKEKARITPFISIEILIFNHIIRINREGERFFLHYSTFDADSTITAKQKGEEIHPYEGWFSVGSPGSTYVIPGVRSTLFRGIIHPVAGGKDVFEIESKAIAPIHVRSEISSRRSDETTGLFWVPWLFPSFIALYGVSQFLGGDPDKVLSSLNASIVGGGDLLSWWITASLVGWIASVFFTNRPRPLKDLTPEELQEMEQDVHLGIFSHEDIAGKYHLTPKTVDAFVKSLSRKRNSSKPAVNTESSNVVPIARHRGTYQRDIALIMKLLKGNYSPVAIKEEFEHLRKKIISWDHLFVLIREARKRLTDAVLTQKGNRLAILPMGVFPGTHSVEGWILLAGIVFWISPLRRVIFQRQILGSA
jgi:hypothetical protein